MGWWTITTDDLQKGDEIRMGTVGAEQFVVAQEVLRGPFGVVQVKDESSGRWVNYLRGEKLTVRR